jgi:hypothetical protein
MLCLRFGWSSAFGERERDPFLLRREDKKRVVGEGLRQVYRVRSKS